MSAKTVNFKRPVKAVPAAADAWVQERAGDAPARSLERMKRFTIDVPQSLHARIKMKCAEDGRKMADVLREILEQKFPAS